MTHPRFRLPIAGWDLSIACAAVVVGAYLRLDRIAAQVLADDEWHALVFMREHGYAAIATHFGVSDHCIPLALLDRLLYHTIGIDELRVRALPLAAGLAALVALPLLLRPIAGAATASCFALLLALYPLHVYWTRSARPYAVSFLLALVSLLSFVRWLEDRSARFAALCVAGAALAAWFHLTAVPFVLAPLFTEAVFRAVRPAAAGPRSAVIGAVAIAATAATLLLLGPPMIGDWAGLAAKAGRAEPFTALTAAESIGLLAGARFPLAIAAWFAVSGAGLTILAQRSPLLARVAAVAVIAQIAGVLVARPWIAHVGIVFVRYVTPVAGVVVLGVAVALAAAWARFGVPARIASLAGVAFWFAAGPLPAIHFRPNAWTNHGAYQFDYDRARNYMTAWLVPPAIPPFYRVLARAAPGSLVIAEAPFYFEWHENPFHVYQEIHRQEVVVADIDELTPHASPSFASGDRRARMRNAIPIVDLERLRARGVRYVLIHRDLRREIPIWDPNEPVSDVHPVLEFLRARCGREMLRDEWLVVFDLSRCLDPGARSTPASPPG